MQHIFRYNTANNIANKLNTLHSNTVAIFEGNPFSARVPGYSFTVNIGLAGRYRKQRDFGYSLLFATRYNFL